MPERHPPPARPQATARPATAPPPPELPAWQPVGWRARGLLVLLALGVAVVLGWLMVQPKLHLMQARQARGEAPVPIGLPTEAHRAAAAAHRASEPPACGAAPVPGCVGGKMEVLVLPAPPPVRP